MSQSRIEGTTLVGRIAVGSCTIYHCFVILSYFEPLSGKKKTKQNKKVNLEVGLDGLSRCESQWGVYFQKLVVNSTLYKDIYIVLMNNKYLVSQRQFIFVFLQKSKFYVDDAVRGISICSLL